LFPHSDAHSYTATQIPSLLITIAYIYNPLNRLTEDKYSTRDYYHYTYDSVVIASRRQVPSGLPSTVNYQYDIANRVTNVNGITYTFDNNGNLLNNGVNQYQYDSANRLKTMTGASVVATYSYRCNGESQWGNLAVKATSVTTNYVLDSTSALTQVLQDGKNTSMMRIKISSIKEDLFIQSAGAILWYLMRSYGLSHACSLCVTKLFKCFCRLEFKS